jgi:hypothetical protein
MKPLKLLNLSMAMLLATSGMVQDRFLTRNGEVKFYSHAPLEDIEAFNDKVLSVIDLNKGEVAVDILIKAFQFEKALMQEHFNENYMESAKYPKSTFKGKFEVPDGLKSMSNGTYPVTVSGDITIHGVTKPLTTRVELVVINGTINTEFSFKVKVKDHDIKIPSVVVRNIAEEVEVTANFKYEPYQR